MSENANNYQPNSTWYVDASYLKLRSVQLYYNVPKQFLSTLRLKKARLYIEGMDLFSTDNIKSMDPESTGASYPTVSTFLLGAQIGF
jgi:hypothetical protein